MGIGNMRYSFECQECGNEAIDTEFHRIGDSHSRPCPICGGLLRRSACFVFNRGMREHFNPTVGRYVTNQRDFNDGLKQASEHATLMTGTEHNYTPVDLRDMDACGATGEGLEHSKRVRRARGMDEPSKTKVIDLAV